MTAVFRSCLPRFYSNTNQSVLSERLSTKTNSIVSLDDNNYDDDEENSMDYSSSLNEKSISNTPNVRSCAATTQLQISSVDEPSKPIDFECRCNQAALPKAIATIDRPKRNRPKSNSSMPMGKRSCQKNSPMVETSPPLLARLVGSIFGDYRAGGDQQNAANKKKNQRSRRVTRVKHTPAKTLPPSAATIKKQFKENEQNLRALLTLLTQIESGVKLSATPPSSTTSIGQQQEPVIAEEKQDETVTITTKVCENEIDRLPIDPIQNEQARNNNRMDDTSSTHSHDDDDDNNHNRYHRRRKSNKQNRSDHHPHSSSSKRYTEGSSRKKSSHKNRRRVVVIHDDTEDDDGNSSSITSQYSSLPKVVRRKMVDNQQQTQLRPVKVTTATSTQFSPRSKNNNTTQTTISEPTWIDMMREDQATINAWARIRRRLKPNQQKDILRALMVICANLFEVPIGNKQM